MSGKNDNTLVWFLRQARQWSDHQQHQVLGSAAEFRDAVNTLTNLVPNHSPTQRRTSCESFSDLTRYYGCVLQDRTGRWQRDEHWNSFQRLIFFSFCLVLHKQHEWTEDEVDRLMSWTSPNMASRKRFRRVTGRIHKAISDLVDEGWSISRATELFLIVPLSLRRLRSLCGNIQNPDDLTAGLVNPDGPESPRKLTIRTNLTFPALMRKACMSFSIDLPIEEICSALGYTTTDSFPTNVDEIVVTSPMVVPTPGLQICIQNFEGDASACSPQTFSKKRKRRFPKVGRVSQSHEAASRRRKETHTNSNSTGESSSVVWQPSGDSQQVDTLVELIRNLGVDLFAEKLLMRAFDAQYRWDADGREAMIQLRDMRLSPGCASLFNSRNELRTLLEWGVQSGKLGLQIQEDDRMYHASDKNPRRPECDHSFRDSLILACYIWPRDPLLDTSTSVAQPQLLPTIRKLFRELEEQDWRSLDPETQRDVVEAWASASDTTRSSLGGKFVTYAQELKLQAPSYTYLELVKAQSISLRRQERYRESSELIECALQSPDLSDVRTHCAIGQLRLSEAENAILQNDLERATALTDAVILMMPQCNTAGAPLMNYLRLQLWTLKGRLYRYKGEFEQATEALEVCLRLRHYSLGLNAYGVVRQLADSYVEAGNHGKAESLLEEYLEYMRKEDKQGSRSYHRLSLSKADAYLAMGRLSEAQSVLERVQQSFVQAPPGGQTDQLDHVRAVLASMRIAMYEEAWSQVRDRADQALDLAQRYSCFTARNYYKGYALRARATASLHLARADMESAHGCVQAPKHFMVGLGTYDLKMALSLYQQKWQACAELTPAAESLVACNMEY